MQIRRLLSNIFAISTLVTLVACSSLTSFKDPEVSLESIVPVSSKGMNPRFKVVLRVTNPNNQDFEMDGVSFNLDVAGKDLLNGVANDIPTLKAYSETLVDVETSISLFELLKLVSYLSKNSNKELHYNLQTTIDPAGFIAFDIENKGVLTDDLLSGLKAK